MNPIKHMFTKHLGKTILVLALMAVFAVVVLTNIKATAPSSSDLAVPTVPQTPAFVFNNNLKLGMTHPDVLELQKYLNANGFVIALTGPGSVGNESAYFGNLTKEALIKFQIANNITPAEGYFGSKTRAVINQKNSPECGTGDLFNRITGAACPSNLEATPSFPAGCTSAQGVSTTTGYSCSTGLPVPPVTSSGGGVKSMIKRVAAEKSSAKDILDMTFADASDPETTVCGGDDRNSIVITNISDTEGTIQANCRMEWGSVIPTIILSSHATVSPRSGVIQDLSRARDEREAFIYTVTAQNGSTKEYKFWQGR